LSGILSKKSYICLTAVINVKRILYFCIIFSAVLIGSPTYALIEGLALGGVSSVAPSEAYDASRNPALLTSGSYDLCLFGALQSRAYTNSKTSFTMSDGVNNISADKKNDSYRTFDVPMGFNIKRGDYGFGILISAGDDNLIHIERNKETLITNSLLQDDIKIEKKSTNPKLSVGFGTKTSTTGSFGISLFGSFDKTVTTEDHNEIIISTGLPNALSKQTTTEQINEVGATFGFRYANNDVEAGLIIASPIFASRTESLKYEDYLLSTTTNDSAKDKFKPITGPEITVGMSYKAAPAIRLYGELSYTMSMTHNETDFNVTSGAITSKDKEKSTNYKAQAHTGIRFDGNSYSIMTGAACILTSEKEHSNDSSGEFSSNTNIRIVYATFGFEIKPTPATTIGIIGMFVTAKGSSDGSGQSLSVSGDINLKQAEVLTGITLKL
jgi:hypothetical protein